MYFGLGDLWGVDVELYLNFNLDQVSARYVAY